MGFSDYVSYVRRNGQCLDIYSFEMPYQYIGDDKYDWFNDKEEDYIGQNLEVPYQSLLNLLENEENTYALGDTDRSGEGEGLVIIHKYSNDVSFKEVKKNFFHIDTLPPIARKIKRMDYDYDSLEFSGSYDHIHISDSPTDYLWYPENYYEIDDSDDCEYTYVCVASIDPPSEKYILNSDYEDVPFLLLNEIIQNNPSLRSKIDFKQSKRRIIGIVRDHFSDVASYLQTVIQKGPVKPFDESLIEETKDVNLSSINPPTIQPISKSKLKLTIRPQLD